MPTAPGRRSAAAQDRSGSACRQTQRGRISLSRDDVPFRAGFLVLAGTDFGGSLTTSRLEIIDCHSGTAEMLGPIESVPPAG